MANLFQEYFVNPIIEYSGYNLINTLVYAFILILVSFFVVYPFFEKKGVKFDFKFALSLLPYIFFGAAFRIIEDMRIFTRSINPLDFGFYTYTPGIYIFVGVLTVLALVASIFLSKKFKQDFHFYFRIIGLIFFVPVLFFDLYHFKSGDGFLMILFTLAATLGATYFVVEKILKKRLLNKLNFLTLSAQTLDGAATFVALQFFTCAEQHIISRALIDNFSPIAFLIVKVVLVLVIIYYVDKDIKDENLRGFIKIFIIILGFATGGRDLLTVGVGTCL